jgi:hypothetical protein
MKALFVLLLAGSLSLNAVLAFAFLSRRETPASSAPAPVAPAAAAAPKIDAEVWPALEGGTLAELAARLRVSGFPPEIVRAVLAARIQESMADRRRALLAPAEAAAFWKDPVRDPAAQLALLQLDREARRQLRELLGDDADADAALSSRPQNFDFLPAAKAAEARRILRDFEESRSELYVGGANPGTDREKFSALEKAQQAALAAALTPAELHEYNLRLSNLANSLREELGAFRPSEDEYRAIYALRAAHETVLNPGVGVIMFSAEENRARTEAQKTIVEQLKAQFGPDRAAEYERAIDPNYRRTGQLVARLDLPPETTGQLWTVQKEFEQRRNDLYRNSTPGNTADRNRQLAALQQEAVARVTPLLGTVGVEAYRQYGGTWLQSMVPRPATPPPSARPAAPATPGPR